MTPDANDPELTRLRNRLAPYARTLFDRAGAHALRLHADVVTLEHLMAVLMHDPESAAHQLVLHAFADPETIAGETLAISPGVMVVAADSTLPFSVKGLRALRRARDLAIERGADEVSAEELLQGASEALAENARDALATVGFRVEALGSRRAASAEEGARESSIDASGPLFRHFTMGAKRSLAAANRGAAQSGQSSISPAQLVIGCLRTEEPLAERTGLTWQRARLLLAAHTLDETAPEPRRLAADETLLGFLRGLDEGVSSLGLLEAVRTRGPVELTEILIRHKISPELLERARGAFEDPDPAS